MAGEGVGPEKFVSLAWGKEGIGWGMDPPGMWGIWNAIWAF